MAQMGHLNYSYLSDLRNLVTGLNFKEIPKSLNCVPCLKGKQMRKPFKKSKKASRASDILELVHSNALCIAVCGPMQTPSWGGKRYFLTFIDDRSRKTFVFFLKGKDKVFEKFREFKKLAEPGRKLKILRTDNEREYVNQNMKKFMKRNGMQHQTTVAYTTEQNRIAEKYNRTIMERARTMIEAANFNHNYWAEAVNTSVYLKNRSPTRTIFSMTPEEAWSSQRPDVSHLRIFGSRAFLHIPDQQRKKLDAKTKEMILVGYCEDSKAYRLMDPNENSGKVYKEKDVSDNNHQRGEDGIIQKEIEVNPLTCKQKDETLEEENEDVEEDQG